MKHKFLVCLPLILSCTFMIPSGIFAEDASFGGGSFEGGGAGRKDVGVFLSFISKIWDAFDIPLTIYGFTFTFKQIFLFSLVTAIIFNFIGRLFNE